MRPLKLTLAAIIFLFIGGITLYHIKYWRGNSPHDVAVIISEQQYQKMDYQKISTRSYSNVRNWTENIPPGLDEDQTRSWQEYEEEEKYRCNVFKTMTNSQPTGTICKQDKCKQFPSFIIIGARKCGTSALKAFLRIHPQLITNDEEVNFFQRQKQPENFQKYRQMMPKAKKSKIVFEKSTIFLSKYGLVTNAARWVHAFNSSIKMIVVLRDPVKRLLSLYEHIRTRYPKRKIKTNFTKEILNADGTIREQSTLFNESNYLHALKRWLCYFPREQFLFLDGELLTKNPAPVLKQVESFLGLKPHFEKSMFYIDSDKGFPCFRKTQHCLRDNKGRKHQDITADTKLKLQKYMKPMVDDMFKLGNFKFEWETNRIL